MEIKGEGQPEMTAVDCVDCVDWGGGADTMVTVVGLLLLSTPLLAKSCLLKTMTQPRQETCQIGEGVAMGQMDDKDMEEASGLAYSRMQAGILWTINDHGGPHSAFALGEDGKKVAQATLKDIKNVDFEDIASTLMDGVPMILVSDTGNNDFDRDPMSILRFREPDVSGGEDVEIARDDIEDLQVRYEGFSYDCEALAVDERTGDLFMFTKDRENSISEVYRYPFPQSVEKNPFTLGEECRACYNPTNLVSLRTRGHSPALLDHGG